MSKKCIAFKCDTDLSNTKNKKSSITLHKFPKDFELRKKWLLATKRRKIFEMDAFLCSLHFEKSCFEKGRTRSAARLKPDAVPTIYKNTVQKKTLPKTKSKTEQKQDPKKIEFEVIEVDDGTLPLPEIQVESPISINSDISHTVSDIPKQGIQVLKTGTSEVNNVEIDPLSDVPANEPANVPENEPDKELFASDIDHSYCKNSNEKSDSSTDTDIESAHVAKLSKDTLPMDLVKNSPILQNFLFSRPFSDKNVERGIIVTNVESPSLPGIFLKVQGNKLTKINNFNQFLIDPKKVASGITVTNAKSSSQPGNSLEAQINKLTKINNQNSVQIDTGKVKSGPTITNVKSLAIPEVSLKVQGNEPTKINNSNPVKIDTGKGRSGSTIANVKSLAIPKISLKVQGNKPTKINNSNPVKIDTKKVGSTVTKVKSSPIPGISLKMQSGNKLKKINNLNPGQYVRCPCTIQKEVPLPDDDVSNHSLKMEIVENPVRPEPVPNLSKTEEYSSDECVVLSDDEDVSDHSESIEINDDSMEEEESPNKSNSIEKGESPNKSDSIEKEQSPNKSAVPANPAKRRQHGGTTCSVSLCNNFHEKTRYLPGPIVSYYCFPKEEQLRKIWIQKCNPPKSWRPKNKRVCSDHFEDDQFEDDVEARIMGITRARKLKRGAIPTIKVAESPTSEKEKQIMKPRYEYVGDCNLIDFSSLETAKKDWDVAIDQISKQKRQIEDLKRENMKLKLKVAKLQDSIDNLNEHIINMSSDSKTKETNKRT